MQSSKLHGAWTSIPDNQFAVEFLRQISWERVKPRERPVTEVKLCSRCGSTASPWLFEYRCHLGLLKTSQLSCELCALLYMSLCENGYYKDNFSLEKVVLLRQTDGVVRVENECNLLSVYVPPSQATSPNAARVGLPCLLEPASSEQMLLMKTWIDVCNRTHKCMVDDNEDGLSLPMIWPRRLLDLGDPLHLVDTSAMTGVMPDYVALSHCWGSLTEAEKLCTYNDNISLMKKNIPIDKLPRTFRDAVTVARGIGARYIWIDSLCIIQDDAKDWATEAAKMGQIFSAAFCTIAATSAMSSVEGFLGPRLEHHIVPLNMASGPVYVRSNIDNFHKDVELGPLNKRGWVLQELALSRRCIFFTSTQVYWMCGKSVHTESLSRLENAKAAFLGDAHFPNSIMKYYRDGRQMLVQDLFERYSSLAFTKPWDRPVAILGLEDRLSKAFKMLVAHGMLARYFPRLLLWKRAGSGRMKTIVQPPGSRRSLPSWSWLSREGPIEYMALDFKKVLWAKNEFQSPFKYAATLPSDGQSKATRTLVGQTAIFPAVARRLCLTHREFRVSIFQDDGDENNQFEDLFGVIIGRDNMLASRTWSPRLHILVIRQVPEEDFFERVGVASLKSRQVDKEGKWVMIH